VINDGRIEQVGSPDDLYDRPANDFVMSFLGPVTTLDGRLVRPHDLVVLPPEADPVPTGAQRGRVARLLRVGFEVRVDVEVETGASPTLVVMTRTEAQGLKLAEGGEVWVAPVEGAPTLVAG
jgi:sulfate transport system ATP-binding protein